VLDAAAAGHRRAAPERFVSGATILLFVAGARGDANVWTFVVQRVETLGETPVLKLVREPRKLYDTRVEVWLDPTRVTCRCAHCKRHPAVALRSNCCANASRADGPLSSAALNFALQGLHRWQGDLAC
jgi:hypothetical protein